MKKYTDAERRKDFEYFLTHYDELYKVYGHKFLVIQYEKILGSYDAEAEAITETVKKYPMGTFIVQECNGDESGYTNYISSWQLISV